MQVWQREKSKCETGVCVSFLPRSSAAGRGRPERRLWQDCSGCRIYVALVAVLTRDISLRTVALRPFRNIKTAGRSERSFCCSSRIPRLPLKSPKPGRRGEQRTRHLRATEKRKSHFRAKRRENFKLVIFQF